MRSSRAFETIDDPADPAWTPHEDGDWREFSAQQRAPGRARQVMVALLVALVTLAVLLLASRGSDDAPPVEAKEHAPLRSGGSIIVVPQGSSASPAEAEEETGTAGSGSGWAPEQVTRKAYSPDRVKGDTSGISPLVTSRLDEVARELGKPITVISGWRTNHEQSELYRKYLAGTGNLAAVPGTSLHEAGRAADAYVDGVALASVPGARRIALAHGLHFPVGGEPWHVELVGDPQGSGRARSR